MFGIWFNNRPDTFVKRPLINEQTTGRFALQRMPIVAVGVNGITGFTYNHPIKALQPATLIPGPSLKLNDPSVTGNNVYQTLHLNPLINNSTAAF